MDRFTHALIESTAYAVIATDTDGLITVFNRAAERLLGYSAQELIGKSTPAPFHLPEEMAQRALELSHSLGRPIEPNFEVFVSETVATRQPDERTWTYVRKDGSSCPVLLSITAVWDETGSLEGYLGIARDMSELAQAQSKMAEHRNRLRAVFEASIDGTLVINAQGRIIDCNSAALQLTGFSRQELLNQNIRLLMGEARAKRYVESIPPPSSDGVSHLIATRGRELPIRRKDGSYFSAEIAVAEVQTQPHEERVFVGTLRDLTEKKAIEEERGRLMELMARTPDFIGMADVEGNLLFQNRAGLRMVGWSDDEDLSKHRIPDVHPRWASKRIIQEAIPHALKHGSWVGESALLDQHGAEIPVSQVLVAHRDHEGKPAYFSTVMRDLRKERVAQAAMNKTMAHVPGLVFSLRRQNDGHCSMPFASMAIEDLLGISRDEAQRSCERFLGRIHEDDITAFEGEMAASAASGRAWSTRFRYRHPSGSVRWYSWQAQPSRDGDDAVLWHGFSADVSEQMAISEQLKRALQEAHAATEAKSEFLATMSHEIRTPLNGVLGMADLLASTPLNEEQQEFLHTIRASGDALLVLINDILDFSKIEAGKLELEYIAFSPQRLLGEVVRLFQDAASRKGLLLRVEHELEENSGILGDPGRFRQVVLNLVSNAIKFTETGEVLIRAWLETQPHGPMVHIEVEDTGIGMSAQQMQHLGLAFTQADSSTTRRYGGTGLGLSICYRLARLMGGEITVSSRIAHGSTFRFSFPAQKSHISAPSAAITSERPKPIHKLRRVLVAEDNRMNQRLVELVLRDFAEEVVVVDTGSSAIEHFGRGHFDVILMDGQMPEMDGRDAAQAIRKLEAARGMARTPIVALSANALPGDREAFLAAGMDAYLSKPLRAEQLREILAQLTRGTRSDSHLAAFPSNNGVSSAETPR